MVLVPAGGFWMGCAPSDKHCAPDEKPRHWVVLESYYIDVHEVSAADYIRCAQRGPCELAGRAALPYEEEEQPFCNWHEEERERLPATCLSWHSAFAYCGWVGKRLPTEAEWERAARGTDGRIYPWGDAPPSDRVCGNTSNGSCAIGSHPTGVSPVGAHDMAGNVEEHVRDFYHPKYYSMSPTVDPRGYENHAVPMGNPCYPRCIITRGGSWRSDAKGLRTSSRVEAASLSGTDVGATMGVRCARSKDPQRDVDR
jgi:formylglycine-generating enzyme required for sulfatase activity